MTKKKTVGWPRRAAALLGMAAVALQLAAGAMTASAQAAWPSKPIRWVVPYTPGGGTDQSSRIIAEKLSVALGQPIVIDNRPGGNTVIGAAAAASAAPDGYTVFFAALSTMAVIPNLYDKLPYASDALTPVTQLVHFPLFLMVEAGGPLDTMPKFLAAARSQPLLFAIGGSGSGGHLGSELMKRQLKADMTAVPFKAMVQAAPEVEVEKAAELYEMRARKRMDETKETAETEREKLAAALEVAKVAAEEAEEAEKGAGLSASDARKAAEELVRLQVMTS